MHDLNHPVNRFPNACPCCGYATLDARGDHEICTICWWQDDGQDNDDADCVRGGPNAALSLSRARLNFLQDSLFDPLRVDLLSKRDSVDDFERHRVFTFDPASEIIAEPATHWSTTIAALDEDPDRSFYQVGEPVEYRRRWLGKTTQRGTVAVAYRYDKLGVWQYQVADAAGQTISKRYGASDLKRMSPDAD